MQSPPESLSIKLPSGLTLAGLRWGASHQPLVLALHGWLDNAATFNELAPLLSDFQILAIDFAGHGLSDHRPAGVSYHIWDNITDILGLLSEIDCSACHVLGHSMGAIVAMLLAVTFPERVKSIALIDGLWPLTSQPEDVPSQLRKALMRQIQHHQRRMPIYMSFDEALTARQRNTPLSLRAVEHIVERGLQKLPEGWQWRNDLRLTLPSPVRLTDAQAEAFIQQLDRPSHLFLASNGLWQQYPYLQEKMSKLNSINVTEVLGHHHFHLEVEGAVILAPLLRAFWHHYSEPDVLSDQ
ncbi:alpha/beta hydrolase [Zooshikella marina]|uniref:alpha/beta fold hydrolase n=1 Tax=Zooshikella ganghwensis TaxID=202772 RepID=UPI001BB006B7|nr:alpha/beta hydrolase [Zooshikella ganghwensis]MBU2705321.1 alpha/beta hydrolase [Zooshikella ganghwensis]